jgi:hypothetical protein
LACPYFMPTYKSDSVDWLHPSRLPLGAGWSGHCHAPGHEGAQPTDQILKDHCNLGYAADCTHLPHDRMADAVRFSVARDHGSQLDLWFVFEMGHRPAGHGKLQYEVSTGRWLAAHPDLRIQKMAECYVESYLRRRNSSPEPAGATA